MTTRTRAAALGALVVVAAFAMRWVNPLTAIGDIKSDEATYVSMALSLAHDGDLTFQKADLDRFIAIYPRGPEGIFLKRQYTVRPRLTASWPFIHLESTPVPTTERVVYGKAFIYPLVAAPFVALGGVSGMLVLNLALFGVSLWCLVRFAQAQAGPRAGLLFGIGFLLFSVAPVYLVWWMPEIFNLALVTVGLFLWLYKRVAPANVWAGWRSPATDLWAAALFAAATYSKPTHLVFIGAMGLAAILERQWRRCIQVGLVGGVLIGALVATNVWTTGQWNYQGAAAGDMDGRKSFYDGYPFDARGTAYETHGEQKVTNDAGSVDTQTSDVFRLLPLNAWYFLVGRDAGLLPFFFPGLAVAVLWLLRIRRAAAWQLGVAAAVLGTVVAFLIFAPYSWNGGGGAPGNRYFLSTYPAMLFLLPRGATWLIGAIAALVGVAFSGSLVMNPFAASFRPWEAVARQPLRALPVELTLVNDLPITVRGPEFSHVPFTKDPVVLFYYLDDNAFFIEGDGVSEWIRGKSSTEILIRTEDPIVRLTLDITSKWVANEVTVSLAGDTQHLHLEAGKTGTLVLKPKPGVWAHASYGAVLHVTTTNGFVPAHVEPTPPGGKPDTRFLGVLVKYSFEVAEKPPGG